MSKAETWLQLVARALWERVKLVYEALQGPSDGLAGEGRGNVARPTPEALKRASCNRDTQPTEDEDE